MPAPRCLPQGRAEFTATGRLSAGAAGFPNLPGDANLYAQIDGVSGHDSALAYTPVRKVLPIRSMLVEARLLARATSAYVYPQSPTSVFVDVTPRASRADDTVNLVVTLNVDTQTITWQSIHSPGDPEPEDDLMPFPISGVSLATTATYVVAVGAARRACRSCAATWCSQGSVGSHAQLAGAILRNAQLAQATLSGAVLSGAVLTAATLTGAQLDGAQLDGANLSGAQLGSAILTGADLTGADLSGADLTAAHVDGADFALVDLRAAAGIDAAVGLDPKWDLVWKVVTVGASGAGAGGLAGKDLSEAWLFQGAALTAPT